MKKIKTPDGEDISTSFVAKIRRRIKRQIAEPEQKVHRVTVDGNMFKYRIKAGQTLQFKWTGKRLLHQP
jgi:ribosomal protein S8E